MAAFCFSGEFGRCVILFWVFIPWKGMKGGVLLCLCCGAIDGWMILDGLLGNCPPKRKKVSVLSK